MDQFNPPEGADAPVVAGVRPRTAEELKEAILDKLTYTVGKNPYAASQRDWFLAVAHATRDIIVEHWIEFDQPHLRQRPQARLLSVARVPYRPPDV